LQACGKVSDLEKEQRMQEQMQMEILSENDHLKMEVNKLHNSYYQLKRKNKEMLR
jgi:hypothetical protein